jgi:hypothetical protein
MATLPLPGKPRPRRPLRDLFLLVLVLVVVAAVTAALTPWGFFMGGSFHLFQTWQGWGRMHSSKAGGDYVLFVSFSPKTGRSMGLRHVSGNARLCTPRGETFTLHMGGDFQKDMGTDTNGKAATFYMSNYSIGSQFSGNTRPSLDLRGKWVNPDLVMDDQGSIARNFEPDGKLYTGHSPGRPYMAEVVAVTLHEGSKSEFEAACQTVKTR